MSGALDAVGAVPGVLGAFLAKDRALTASSLPLIFSTDSLGEACAPLEEALKGVAEAGSAAEGIAIRFGDARVVGAPLKSGELLWVVCQANMDSNALKQLQDVLRDLRTRAELPSGLSGQAVPGLVLPLTQSATPLAGVRSSQSGSTQEPRASLPGLQVRSARADESAERGMAAGASSSMNTTQAPPSTSPEASATPSGLAVRSTGRSQRSGPLVSPESRSRLVQELARFVGPVAQLLVDEQLQSAQQLAQGIERLSREIESLEDREEFLSRVSALST